MKAKCVGGVLDGQEVEIRGERIKAARPWFDRRPPLQNHPKDYRYLLTAEYDWYDLMRLGPDEWRYELDTGGSYEF